MLKELEPLLVFRRAARKDFEGNLTLQASVLGKNYLSRSTRKGESVIWSAIRKTSATSDVLRPRGVRLS
ncbi:MAG: hypothetical protein WBP10_17460 [Thermoanaerobaculia bacterium]